VRALVVSFAALLARSSSLRCSLLFGSDWLVVRALVVSFAALLARWRSLRCSLTDPG